MFLATILKGHWTLLSNFYKYLHSNSLLKALFPIRKMGGIFLMGFLMQNTLKKWKKKKPTPNFHRWIKDVSVAIHLWSVVDYKMAIKSVLTCVHTHLPHDSAAPSPNLGLAVLLFVAISGILRMPYKETGPAYQRRRAHVWQRWAVLTEAFSGQMRPANCWKAEWGHSRSFCFRWAGPDQETQLT